MRKSGMHYFDYRKAASAANIRRKQLTRMRSVLRREFPRDDMMFELHMLRVCTAIRDGHVTIEQALEDESTEAA
jgi:hypothetical protein